MARFHKRVFLQGEDGYFERTTVEKLAVDCIDVRGLHRRGCLNRRPVPGWGEFIGPSIDRIRFDRYWIYVELRTRPSFVQLVLVALNKV